MKEVLNNVEYVYRGNASSRNQSQSAYEMETKAAREAIEKYGRYTVEGFVKGTEAETPELKEAYS